jgi:hypothetical protein
MMRNSHKRIAELEHKLQRMGGAYIANSEVHRKTSQQRDNITCQMIAEGVENPKNWGGSCVTKHRYFSPLSEI